MENSPFDYDAFLKLVRSRRNSRQFKPDPFPEEYIEKIIEPARWAMSGANSQPCEFIVVKDSSIRKQLFDAYCEVNLDYIFWMEQQRRYELRHPGCQVAEDMDPDEALRIKQTVRLWGDAPVVVAVVGDPRKQWGTIVGAHTFSLGQSHFTDAMAMACYLIHLSAAALGLSSQWVSVHLQQPHKRILQIPDEFWLHSLIPIGYPEEHKGGYREKLQNLIHYDKYDMSRHLSNKQIIEKLENLRKKTTVSYVHFYQD